MKHTHGKKLLVRAGHLDDLATIHQLLMTEIDQNPYYNQITKTTEKQRLTPSYLKHLYTIDPHLLMIGMVEGKIAGFIIACPSQGAIIIDWALALHEYKPYLVSSNVLRKFIDYFDQNQWHKISAYVITKNRRPALLLAGYDFKKTCVLKAHFFGEDYSLWELPLNKTKPGYELGIRTGRWGCFKQWFMGK